MARRPSSSARSSARGSRPSSGSSSRSAGGRSRSGAAARDGKVDIYCPQCAAHFRIAETGLDSKVTCTECTRTFFAKTAVGKRARAKDNSKVYLGFGIGAVVIIASLIMISNSGGGGETRRTEAPVNDSRTALEKDKSLRRDHLIKWAQFISRGEMYGIRQFSDMPALTAALGVSPSLTGGEFDAAFQAALKTNDVTRLLVEMEPASADTSDAAVQANGGEATIFLRSKPGDTVYDPKAGGSIVVQWQLDGSAVRVSSFQIGKMPVIRGRRPGDSGTGKTFIPSEDVAKPEVKEVDVGGQTFKAYESPPVPLGHLKETPPAMQQEVDQAVANLLASATSDMPADANRARIALAMMALPDRPDRNPAIPRLLNALNDLYPDVMGNNQKILQVTECLLQITGMEFAYDFRGEGDQAVVKAKRESVIRQWFAWWYRYANDTHHDAIEKEEDLDSPTSARKAPGK